MLPEGSAEEEGGLIPLELCRFLKSRIWLTAF